MFINVAYTFDFTNNSLVEFKRADSSTLDSAEFITLGSYSAGLGFKFQNKYSVEFRYITLTKRSIQYSNSNFNSLSIIFGYTIF
ncbi:hypothetical protein MTsPCn9_23380 [Croceitalea sp. MTPC9]|uniref:hypothetical protein n=1 Tax=unclassified Croceitalea TaxID=2632280 RepID=UPI002B37C4A1|nr:hypothetical protein MTsPCn6_20160 [Croceitalea sp. MTPC6]GMN17400.1 hypothetical protein MTsPCn9_23380 [Croceitalea sp. MTPC9]